jgi:transposase
MPKHSFVLLESERQALLEIVNNPKAAVWKTRRAQVLLKAAVPPSGAGWTDAEISDAYQVSTRSIESWRRKACEEGPLSLLERGTGKGRALKLDGDQEAKLTAIACSDAPPGQCRWTLTLLANRMVELRIVESVSRETVRKTLKKTI